MVKVFCFCIFGGQKKYCQGLIENLKIINREFPDFETWIYVGVGVPEEYLSQYATYSNVKLIQTSGDGMDLACNRAFPIDDPDVEVSFSRDADSRIHARDIWCIKEFINSDFKFNIIRDNFWHKTKITGGSWGLKKGLVGSSIKKLHADWTTGENQYGIDQDFFEQVLYPLVKDDMLVLSNIVAFKDEQNVRRIPHYLYNRFDFVLNVFDYVDDVEIPMFDYETYPKLQHLEWLYHQNQWDIINYIESTTDLFQFSSHELHDVVRIYFLGYYFIDDVIKARRMLENYKYTHIFEIQIPESFILLPKIKAIENKTIIATCDSSREPKDDEVIVCFGNYHFSYENLPWSNKIYLHPLFYNCVRKFIDIFEYDHSIWDHIEQIYILNLRERRDRYLEVMVELTRLQAPLNIVYHYMAEKDEVVPENKTLNQYLGATKNHIDVVKHFIENGYKNCLILEDDVTFTSNIKAHQADLRTFFKRDYEYDVCLLTSSMYHNIKPYDDLLLLSMQECTTSSAYLLNKDTCQKVLDCFITGYNVMLQTGDYNTYVIDRFWSRIQKDKKFFLFNRKFGYQRPNYSSITGSLDCHFD